MSKPFLPKACLGLIFFRNCSNCTHQSISLEQIQPTYQFFLQHHHGTFLDFQNSTFYLILIALCIEHSKRNEISLQFRYMSYTLQYPGYLICNFQFYGTNSNHPTYFVISQKHLSPMVFSVRDKSFLVRTHVEWTSRVKNPFMMSFSPETHITSTLS